MKTSFSPGLPWARRCAPALVFTLLVSTAAAFGATLYVAKSGADNPACGFSRFAACLTIQYTISNRAQAGDVIKVEPGIYSELVTVDKNLTLSGPFVGRAIIDGAHNGTVVTNTATATLERLIIRNGSATIAEPTFASIAGGINNGGTLTLLESLVTDNSASGFVADDLPLVGGVLNSGMLTVKDSSIVSNSGMNGCATAGGLFNGGTLVTENSLIALNTVSGGNGCPGPGSLLAAGGLFNISANAAVKTTTIWQNSVSNNGSLTLSQSTVNSTAVNNYSHLTVINSTLFESDISNSLGELNGIFDMSNSTVWNTSTAGVSGGPPLSSTIRNSILAGNSGGDCAGSYISGDYNIVQDTTGCSLVGGGHDITGVSPNLGALRFNGGPTQTMYLLAHSPAINGGNPAGCKDSAGNPITVDQRGFPRPFPHNGRCDIGAVEDQPFFWF